jgi:Tfp pilus assembly protein FimT
MFVVGVLLAIATARLGAAADRAAVRSAAGDAAALISTARSAAIHRRAPVAVTIDSIAVTLQARSDTVVLFRRDLGAAFRVRIRASRDSMAFDARGFGIGAANLSLVITRGDAVDTLFLSRLGRARY